MNDERKLIQFGYIAGWIILFLKLIPVLDSGMVLGAKSNSICL